MKGLTIILSLLCIFVILLANGCIEETEYSPGNEPVETEKLEILEHELETGEYGTLKVVGKAENIGENQLSYAEIRVKFYDKDGVLLETFFDNINDLDAGEIWAFEVMYPGIDNDKVDNYDIAVGSLW